MKKCLLLILSELRYRNFENVFDKIKKIEMFKELIENCYTKCRLQQNIYFDFDAIIKSREGRTNFRVRLEVAVYYVMFC